MIREGRCHHGKAISDKYPAAQPNNGMDAAEVDVEFG
jgi:hypothetical protein